MKTARLFLSPRCREKSRRDDTLLTVCFSLRTFSLRTFSLRAVLLPALALFSCASLHAQVTIGGLTDPAKGAILDLNSSAKGGLLLSNVSIIDLSKIPAGSNLFPGITAGVNDDTNTDFTGAIVYNTNPKWGAGTFVWDGSDWTQIGKLPPGITEVSPASGLISGGTSITITGTNLNTAYMVFIDLNGNSNPDAGEECTNINITGDTLITCQTPTAGNAGSCNVAVKTMGGTAKLNNAFTYLLPPPVISGIIPASGLTSGGTIVVISGENFVAGATTVAIGGTSCAISLISSTEITCTTSAKIAGTYSVVAVTAYGSSNTNVEFTYLDPTIQSFTKFTCPADITIVRDERDNHYYAIQKMADGNCWMLTNLAYAGGIDNQGNEFSISHYTEGKGSSTNESDWCINCTSQRAYYTDPCHDGEMNGGKVTQYDGTTCTKSYATSTSDLDYTECGYIYNWHAASAGAGIDSDNNATKSICPAGWRLPTGGANNHDFSYLNGKMNGDVGDSNSTNAAHAANWLATGAWHGAYSGYFLPGYGLGIIGEVGIYWSATVSSTGRNAYDLIIDTRSTPATLMLTGTNLHGYGHSVRCIAN
jgi:uncharacterized protein (TIGR02145 family)